MARLPAMVPIEMWDVPRAHDPAPPRLNILLLCDDAHPANVVRDHVAAIRDCSVHNVVAWNPIECRTELPHVVDLYDAVIIHYSIYVLGQYYLPDRISAAIENFGGLKIQWIQDEYRSIDAMVSRMSQLGIHVIISSLRPENIRRVYHHESIERVWKFGALSGIIPSHLEHRQVVPLAARQVDIIGRMRPQPWWLGHHARRKQLLAETFPAVADSQGLTHDLSSREEDRIYGDAWFDFLESGRAMLGAEGGSSLFDFDGSVERRTLQYLEKNPEATFDVVHDAVLAPHDGRIVHAALTPRMFEAICVRTALVLLPGRYGDVLEPGVHYIPLREDYSNIEEVVSFIRDTGRLSEMTGRVHADVVGCGRFSDRRLGEDLDAVLHHVLAQAVSGHNLAAVRSPRHKSPKWLAVRSACRRMRLQFQLFVKNRLGFLLKQLIWLGRRTAGAERGSSRPPMG